MKNILDILIDDFHERALPELMLRHQSMVWVPRKANVVVGMRRSGKTWFCYQQMRELLEKGLEKERLLYLNFEDERLLPFSANDFQLILETYYRKFPAFKSKQCYLFLDEVQRIEGWDKFVRRVLDTEKLSVCVTGSSSKLLSTEIATSLRGRSLTTEIFPFSFREFLSFKKVILKSGQRFGSKTRAMLQNLISQYIKTGGFPEVQNFDDGLRRDVLRNYLDVVILRDVIERHSITNTLALRSLIKHVMSAPATRFSVNKFYNSLRSQGIACTKNSLYDYIDHLADTFLFYQVPIHSRSERARRVNPKKIYVIDSGLQEAMSLRMIGDRGALLENLVYMHFRRQGLAPEYYVTKNGVEVDYVLSAKDGDEYRLIQVCWDIHDPNTQKREVGALLSAMGELGLKRGTIVTWLDEDLSDKRLEIVPAWKWLLAE
ncbi:MAG: ATP-binding protein [Thermodesulfobacteriota bacterium]|nr:ATP-binding protein [Thermodesulfobacteriota bacterium]